jgi:hypothetical protein
LPSVASTSKKRLQYAATQAMFLAALVQGANVTELLAKARGDIRGSVAVVLRNNEADPVATAAFYDKLGREGLGVLKVSAGVIQKLLCLVLFCFFVHVKCRRDV